MGKRDKHGQADETRQRAPSKPRSDQVEAGKPKPDNPTEPAPKSK